jgi:two-component system, NtrC family, nitrogen regulation sensor histidine kinase NtrY
MFRRYPYWGWLLLCVLLWSVNGYYYHTHRQETLPERMARAVNKDLQAREDKFAAVTGDADLVNHLFTDSLTYEEVQRMSALPLYVYAYENNYLKFWNTNAILPAVTDTSDGAATIVKNEKGVFIQKNIQQADTNRTLVVMFPVLYTYPVENNYLKSQFAASELIPVNTRIIPASIPTAGTYPVTMRNGKLIFQLLFNLQDIQKWVPDELFLLLLIAALLASISWIHLMIIYLTRNKSSLTGFIVTLSVILTLRIYLYAFGIPFHLDTLLFFSPRLYASSTWLSSFGDLFINTLCVLWLVIFIGRHTEYKTYFENLRSSKLRKWLPAILVVLMIGYLLLYVRLIRSLVLDSSISFDVSRFYSINQYTILGLLVICTITGISAMIIYLFNFQLRQLMPDNRKKYGLVALCGVLLLLISGNYADIFYWYLLGWLLLFLLLLDIPKLTLVSDLFEPQMIFWALFICVFCTGILQYFNAAKEREARKAFIEQHLAPHRDNVLEYTFDKTVGKLEHDLTLKQFFYKPSLSLRKSINNRFDTMYLNSAAATYTTTLYLFDDEGHALYNSDSGDYYSLMYEKNEAVPTTSPYLFYKEGMPDKHSYLSFIPVYSDTINNKIGYVVIDFSPKKQAAETVYPELLLPASGKANLQDNEYAYAVYISGRLATQVREYPFNSYLKFDTLKEQNYAFYDVNKTSELHYKISDKRTIVAVYNHNTILETITVFSYLFSIQVGLAIIILLYQFYLSYFARPLAPGKYVRLTLRKRIQYAMLAIVFVSFVFIGIVTIWFFSSSYRSTNANNLQKAMQIARQSVQDYLNNARAYESDYQFDSVTQSNGFRKFLTNIASNQKIDINLFDNNGNLFAASQDEIYQKGLISRIIRQDAYYQLNVSGKSVIIQNERVAGLSYLSAYEPLRDERGVALGYLNVPFFSSEKDLNFQISNIVITLINVYAFIFLISSLITVWITRWVTGSFNVIIEQFGRLNLQRNERITWPYNDEIGLLVTEYNKMVNKVEENAALLAQSERETAWREMARQVAHEIKNPLTPMKLNIQYLQQAIRNDNPNIKELTGRLSESIIEQIDNLSYIASEFSNFAKMPEARPEELELGELLQLATGLYRNEQHIQVNMSVPPEKIFVFSDHSQLLRMLTNLLENAKQAIPADRQGKIEVTLHCTDASVATITITDNGHGISEEVAQRIFQPYFTTKSSGTGLGLAMTKKIIEFWKGEIWFESEEGKGSTFFIRLPVLRRST